MHGLHCGCTTCGCLCADHSPTGTEQPCARHGVAIVTRWIAGEVAALASLCLLIASAAVWAAIFSQPG